MQFLFMTFFNIELPCLLACLGVLVCDCWSFFVRVTSIAKPRGFVTSISVRHEGLASGQQGCSEIPLGLLGLHITTWYFWAICLCNDCTSDFTGISGKKKAHKHKLFGPVGFGTVPVCPWDKPRFSLFHTVEAEFVPGFVPGTNSGSNGRRKSLCGENLCAFFACQNHFAELFYGCSRALLTNSLGSLFLLRARLSDCSCLFGPKKSV